MWLKLATAHWRDQWGLVLGQILCIVLTTFFAWSLALAPAILDGKIRQDAGNVDLLVTAPTSPLQALLALLYHVDLPVGAIPYATLAEWSKHPLVAQALAITVGDNLNGYRLIGIGSTDGQFASAANQMAEFYRAQDSTDQPLPLLQAGRLPRPNESTPNQALLGAAVAADLHLPIGQTFNAQHGLQIGGIAHTATTYSVAGILNPTHTVLDRLILIPIGSVWFMHEGAPNDAEELAQLIDAREISALLLRYRTPLAVATLPKIIRTAGYTAASPALESQRLQPLFDKIETATRGMTLLIATGALLALALAMQLGLQVRRQTVLALRLLGASHKRTASVLALEYLVIYLLATLFAAVLLWGVLVTIIFPAGWPWIGDLTLLFSLSMAVFATMAITLGLVLRFPTDTQT